MAPTAVHDLRRLVEEQQLKAERKRSERSALKSEGRSIADAAHAAADDEAVGRMQRYWDAIAVSY